MGGQVNDIRSRSKRERSKLTLATTLAHCKTHTRIRPKRETYWRGCRCVLVGCWWLQRFNSSTDRNTLNRSFRLLLPLSERMQCGSGQPASSVHASEWGARGWMGCGRTDGLGVELIEQVCRLWECIRWPFRQCGLSLYRYVCAVVEMMMMILMTIVLMFNTYCCIQRWLVFVRLFLRLKSMRFREMLKSVNIAGTRDRKKYPLKYFNQKISAFKKENE